MPPRNRKPENEQLPPNVYTNVAKGLVYYYWQHPISLAKHPLGRDRDKAIERAKLLNAGIASMGVDPLVRAQKPVGMTVAELIKKYEPTAMKKLGSDNSRKATTNYLERIEAAIGDLVLTRITVKDLSTAFADLPDSTYIKMRTELVKLFSYALSQGDIPHHIGNAAGVMEKRSEPKVQRQRLTLEDYKKIYKHEDTPEYLRVAMDLMLHLTARPNDVIHLKFSQVDGDTLITNIRKNNVIQGIKLHQQELEIIQRARRSGIVSPYIVHALPDRHVASVHQSKEKAHPTQLTLDKLSGKFSEIRDELKIGHGKKGKPPTLYEIRSLATRMYEEQGRIDDDLSKILGHLDRNTKDIYRDPRNLQKIIIAEAGLKVDMA